MKIPFSVAVVVATAGVLSSAGVTARQAGPVFEVVSVKRNLAGGPVAAFPIPRGFRAQNFTARELVELAFELPEYRLSGGPEWSHSERFDISARTGTDASYGQMLLMLRAALGQRFQLATRIESREQSRYALVLDREDRRLGAGLRAAGTECLALTFPKDGPPPPPPPPAGPAATDCPSMFGPGFMSARLVELQRIVEFLAREPTVQRAVVDKTGLAGKYNADASWNFEGVPGPAGAPVFRMNPDGPTIFTALREQLGLRLQPERGPVDVLVIERMERPMED
jgi:uncharacterized protein (TIGR03435 family)